MRVFLSLLVLLLLLSCRDKDVDGVLKVFRSFTLIDEDGRRITVPEGMHSAEFTYKWSDSDVELEIEEIDGGEDRDFDFKAPLVDEDDVTITKHEEQVKMSLLSSVTRQPVGAEVVIRNVIKSRSRPKVFWDRCTAYRGVKDGMLGYLKIKDKKRENRTGGHGGLASHIYSVSSWVESQLSVMVAFNDGEEVVAVFEGNSNLDYRDLLWEGECGSYERPIIRRP